MFFAIWLESVPERLSLCGVPLAFGAPVQPGRPQSPTISGLGAFLLHKTLFMVGEAVVMEGGWRALGISASQEIYNYNASSRATNCW